MPRTNVIEHKILLFVLHDTNMCCVWGKQIWVFEFRWRKKSKSRLGRCGFNVTEYFSARDTLWRPILTHCLLKLNFEKKEQNICMFLFSSSFSKWVKMGHHQSHTKIFRHIKILPSYHLWYHQEEIPRLDPIRLELFMLNNNVVDKKNDI